MALHAEGKSRERELVHEYEELAHHASDTASHPSKTPPLLLCNMEPSMLINTLANSKSKIVA